MRWDQLREHNGSVNDAFEEMCCLLARHPVDRDARLAAGWTFDRIGRPDAGKECLWTSPRGKQEIWQAKWFQSGLSAVQWKQVDKSVQRAIDEHPNLVKVTVCTNHDRPDPKGIDKRSNKTKKTSLDHWEQLVKSWKSRVASKGGRLEVVFWGTSELFDQLNQLRHVGRKRYFFDRELFLSAWFKGHIDEQIVNAGPRYTPESNVNLPTLTRAFDFLGSTTRSIAPVTQELVTLKKSYGYLFRAFEESKATDEITLPYKLAYDVLCDIAKATIKPVIKIVGPSCKNALDQLHSANDAFHKAFGDSLLSSDVTKDPKGEALGYGFRQFNDAARQLLSMVDGIDGRCAQTGALLLIGRGGSGKTHLLCDVALHRVSTGLPTLLLLGQQHDARDPWPRIWGRTALAFESREEFLGALDTAGEIANCRALILFDALNEVGDDPARWMHELPGMLEVIRRYSHIAIAFGIRDSYRDYIVPKALDESVLPQLNHYGFQDNAYEAVRIYFEHYNIRLSDTPLLEPEFTNPLFLKVFCQAIAGTPDPHNNRAPAVMPAGLVGISSVFSAFVAEVERRLINDLQLETDLYSNPVLAFVDSLAKSMAERKEAYLPRHDAVRLADAMLRTGVKPGRPVQRLVSEGLLIFDIQYRGVGAGRSTEEVVRFNYDRFAAHQIARHLLDTHVDADGKLAFKAGSHLYEIVTERAQWLRNANIAEALLVQVPERFGLELFDLDSKTLDLPQAKEKFVESLIWRTSDSFSEYTRVCIGKCLDRPTRHLVDQWFEVLLTLSVRKSHPLNSESLYRVLVRPLLPERDAMWTSRLPTLLAEGTALSRLIDWSLRHRLQSPSDRETCRLAALALAWCFSTTIVQLRDRATLAMVALLQDHLDVAEKMISTFRKIDDMYILERVVAAAYGAALRNRDRDALHSLAATTYRQVFEDGSPPVHIMIRDYACGIIEYALHCGNTSGIAVNKVRPPYHSQWVKDVPTADQLDPSKTSPEKREEGLSRLWSSCNGVRGFGDFGIYVIGTGTTWSDWVSRKVITTKSFTLGAKTKSPFDHDLPHRFVFSRVLGMGWTSERFGNFDSRNYGSGRSRPLKERIGKKYQWIALREFQARVVDNFIHKDHWRGLLEYNGPWEWPLRGRDLDPSMLLQRPDESSGTDQDVSPILHSSGPSLDSPINDDEWLGNTNDLPSPADCLLFRDPDTKQTWVRLQYYQEWRKSKPSPSDESLRLDREVHLILNGYLVKREQAKAFQKWAASKELYNDPLPRSPQFIDQFWGELWWSPSVAEMKADDGYPWVTSNDMKQPCSIIPTARSYLQESTWSGNQKSLSINVPDSWLAEQLGAQPSRKEGTFVGTDGTVIAFDPSIDAGGHSALLVRADVLKGVLDRYGLKVVWTLLGEKNIYPYKNDHLMFDLGGGRLIIRGAYVLQDDRVEGEMFSRDSASASDA